MLMRIVDDGFVGLVLGATEPVTPNGEYSKFMPPSPVGAVVVDLLRPACVRAALF